MPDPSSNTTNGPITGSPDDSTAGTAGVSPRRSKPRKSRRRRVIVWSLWIFGFLLLGGGIFISAGGLTGLVIPIIERETGLDVTRGSVVMTAGGQFELRDAILRAPDIDGPGGEIIRLDRAVISMKWGSILSGAKAISGVVIERPRLRVSQNSDTGIVNLQSLVLKSSGGGGATPALTISNGIIEVGEHSDGDYTMLKQLSAVGSLSKPDSKGIAHFNFRSTSTVPSLSSGNEPQSSRGDFMISGTISDAGVLGSMTGLSLEDWPAEIVPSRVRETYEALDLTGDLAPTRFSVGPKGKPKITLTLEGVDISLPFDPPAEFAGPERFLRMRSTRGTIDFVDGGLKAKLKGDIDDLLYDVTLDFDEYSSDSPFTCDLRTTFKIEEGFRPLQFLPDRVTEKLDRFVGLTAQIDATVNLVRHESSDGQAPVLVSGKAEVSNASARYEEFMYPFENIRGVISFTPDGVYFDNITGTGPTGATLSATGIFDGMGENSVVEILVAVKDLPIDQYLLGAMDNDQRDLVDTLFSRSQYQNLLDSGFLLEPEHRKTLTALRDELVATIADLPSDTSESTRAALSSRLSIMNSTLRVPEFDFGGLIGVDVTLRRHPERPEDDRWTTDIAAVIPNAGIVPKQFPLPIVARDVNISIENGSVYLTGGRYDGLSGGSATVEARFEKAPGADDPKPYVSIKARQIPIDERLVAAIPGYYDKQPADPSEITLRRILDRLRMQGIVEANAEIGPGSDGRVTYEVEAGVLSGSAHPLNMGLQILDEETIPGSDIGLDTVQLTDMRGTIVVTQSLIVVNLNGLMESPSQPIPPTEVELLTQLTLPREPKFGNIKRVDGLLPFEAGPPVSGPQLYTRVRADGLDLAMPLEHAIAVLSPSFAKRVAQWRGQYEPDGVMDMQAILEGRVGASLDTNLQINQIQEIGFTYQGHRYELGSSIGPLALSLGTRPKLSSRGFSIPISIDHEPMGEIGLAGSIRLTRGGQLIELNNEPSIRLSMDRGRLGSPGVRAVVNSMGSGGAQGAGSFFDFYGLDGEFDLLIDITPIDGARFAKGAPGTMGIPAVEIDGSMIPKSLSMRRGGDILEFWNDPQAPDEIDGESYIPSADPPINRLTGSIRFDGLDGYFDHIVASNEDYSLTVDGRWAVDPGNGASVDLDIAAIGDIIDGPVRVILPDTLSRVVDQLEVSSTRDVDLDRLHITANRLGATDTTYDIHGSASVLDVSALVGVPITELDGRVNFSVHSGGTQSRTMDIPDPTRFSYQIDLEASRLRAGLLRVHNAVATVINDPDQPGVVLVPELRAGMHGGMVSGNAQIRPDDQGVPFYSTEIRASGVRAAPIFDDLFLPVEGLTGPPAPGSSTVRSAWNVDADVSRGIMLADMALSGPLGAPDQRVGRGFVRVSGGSVVALPGLINLIEASNLTLPTGSRLNLAEAELYIDGSSVAFERLSASSQSVEILGYGTMDWTSRDIDLRFRSRSIDPIPVLSNLLEGIRDELITIRVTGAPGSITYSPEQFGTTKRLLDSMFGTTETEQQRRLREVESRTRVGSGRLRDMDDERVERPTRMAPIKPSSSFSSAADAENEDQ